MLYEHQEEAARKLRNGNILVGGVGAGKSRAGIAYYCLTAGGDMEWAPPEGAPDLYIITTARKRDDHEWDGDLAAFGLYPGEGSAKPRVIVDSWNNIRKYEKVFGAFFLFDEQRVVGSGAWVKAFLRIARRNKWILLTATPGDDWADYIPVFIANGFYRNKTEFLARHAVWNRYTKYPKVDRWVEEERLIFFRDRITVHMNYSTKNQIHRNDILTDYDSHLYKLVWEKRWDPWTSLPVKNISELCYLARKVANSDPSRGVALLETLSEHPRLVVFYNFDYELDILRDLAIQEGVCFTEYNGHVHQSVPEGERWMYFVNYTAGSEAWNCTTTDTIFFWSLSYSYRVMTQAAGRIDRNNTPFDDLYYFYARSDAPIDKAIVRALRYKKNFNERRFVGEF